MVWAAMENSTAPVKDEKHVYRSPLDWSEYRAWIRLYEKHKQGGFNWEHDPDDPRNN